MIMVTGGAGFIGSNLVEKLNESTEDVLVIDNLVSGKKSNLPKGTKFLSADIADKRLSKHLKDVTVVYHLAADPDVRSSVKHPITSFQINVDNSMTLLENCRQAGVETFIFASSGGTVYGDAPKAVSEKKPFRPISPYGASKAAFEMYLSAYAHTYGMNTSSLRLGNVIGPRSEHGVIWDFFWKLRKDPNALEILGDGKQSKSYIHVSDVVDAFVLIAKNSKGFEPFNVANKGTLTVTRIAELVADELKLNPTFNYTGDERGWVGDVRKISMKIKKLKKLGWAPKYSQEEAVRMYLRYLMA